MPRLIHLNGPSGVGKSTIARMYADRHPGVLNLDADRLVHLVGGWRDDVAGTLPAVRRLAIAMATTHLRGGCDVVMPQLVARVGQARRFEAAAARGRAVYREIVLTASLPETTARLDGRTDQPWDFDAASVARCHRNLTVYLADRPRAVVVPCEGLDPERVYAEVMSSL